MQVTDDLVRTVVQEVLAGLRNGTAAKANGQPRPSGQTGAWGVFDDVDAAVAAARDAQREFEKRGLDERRKAVDCVRRICIEQADTLGREELEETKIGRLDHKIGKLKVAGERTPGVEWMKTEAYTGENGIALVEVYHLN